MNDGSSSMNEIFGGPIHTYGRTEAIADGILVDVTETAREAGFAIPVALTIGAWEDCVAWSEADSHRGRLWDVLWMAAQAARNGSGKRLAFQLYRVPRDGRKIRPRLTTLHMVIGPGDAGEPVITILLPGED
jgi:hypothetical protein